jgi:hypothetical protein
MDSIRMIVRQLDAWWAYAFRCAKAPMSVSACDSFWMWVATAVAAIGLYVFWRTVRYLLAVLAEWQWRIEQGRIADKKTMAKYKIDSDTLHPGSPGEDVAQRIRQALDDRKKTDQWQRPGPRTGSE